MKKNLFTRIKTMIGNKLAEWFGWVTSDKVFELDQKCTAQFNRSIEEIKAAKKTNSELMLANLSLKEKLASQPYEFDDLLQLYSEDQINAWEYKLINHARNNSQLNYLLERWKERIQDAQDSLVPKEHSVSSL